MYCVLVASIGVFCLAYQEMLVAKKCKVRAEIFINIIFFSDGQASNMLVVELDKPETYSTRFELASI